MGFRRVVSEGEGEGASTRRVLSPEPEPEAAQLQLARLPYARQVQGGSADTFQGQGRVEARPSRRVGPELRRLDPKPASRPQLEVGGQGRRRAHQRCCSQDGGELSLSPEQLLEGQSPTQLQRWLSPGRPAPAPAQDSPREEQGKEMQEERAHAPMWPLEILPSAQRQRMVPAKMRTRDQGQGQEQEEQGGVILSRRGHRRSSSWSNVGATMASGRVPEVEAKEPSQHWEQAQGDSTALTSLPATDQSCSTPVRVKGGLARLMQGPPQGHNSESMQGEGEGEQGRGPWRGTMASGPRAVEGAGAAATVLQLQRPLPSRTVVGPRHRRCSSLGSVHEDVLLVHSDPELQAQGPAQRRQRRGPSSKGLPPSADAGAASDADAEAALQWMSRAKQVQARPGASSPLGLNPSPGRAAPEPGEAEPSPPPATQGPAGRRMRATTVQKLLQHELQHQLRLRERQAGARLGSAQGWPTGSLPHEQQQEHANSEGDSGASLKGEPKGDAEHQAGAVGLEPQGSLIHWATSPGDAPAQPAQPRSPSPLGPDGGSSSYCGKPALDLDQLPQASPGETFSAAGSSDVAFDFGLPVASLGAVAPAAPRSPDRMQAPAPAVQEATVPDHSASAAAAAAAAAIPEAEAAAPAADAARDPELAPVSSTDVPIGLPAGAESPLPLERRCSTGAMQRGPSRSPSKGMCRSLSRSPYRSQEGSCIKSPHSGGTAGGSTGAGRGMCRSIQSGPLASRKSPGRTPVCSLGRSLSRSPGACPKRALVREAHVFSGRRHYRELKGRLDWGLEGPHDVAEDAGPGVGEGGGDAAVLHGPGEGAQDGCCMGVAEEGPSITAPDRRMPSMGKGQGRRLRRDGGSPGNGPVGGRDWGCLSGELSVDEEAALWANHESPSKSGLTLVQHSGVRDSWASASVSEAGAEGHGARPRRGLSLGRHRHLTLGRALHVASGRSQGLRGEGRASWASMRGRRPRAASLRGLGMKAELGLSMMLVGDEDVESCVADMASEEAAQEDEAKGSDKEEEAMEARKAPSPGSTMEGAKDVRDWPMHGNERQGDEEEGDRVEETSSLRGKMQKTHPVKLPFCISMTDDDCAVQLIEEFDCGALDSPAVDASCGRGLGSCIPLPAVQPVRSPRKAPRAKAQPRAAKRGFQVSLSLTSADARERMAAAWTKGLRSLSPLGAKSMQRLQLAKKAGPVISPGMPLSSVATPAAAPALAAATLGQWS